MEATAQSSAAVNNPTQEPELSAFLRGNFAPVEGEVTVGTLKVHGALPTELSGVLLRNGPNPAGAVPPKHHWFVGDAMLHAVRIEGGRASGYRNRYVRTERIQSVLGLPAAPRSPNDTHMGSGSIQVVDHGGHLLALGEVGLPYEIDQANTLGQYDFAGALRTNMTGHPKADPITGGCTSSGTTSDQSTCVTISPTVVPFHQDNRDPVHPRRR